MGNKKKENIDLNLEKEQEEILTEEQSEVQEEIVEEITEEEVVVDDTKEVEETTEEQLTEEEVVEPEIENIEDTTCECNCDGDCDCNGTCGDDCKCKETESEIKTKEKKPLGDNVWPIGMIIGCILCIIALFLMRPTTNDLKNPELYHFTETKGYLFMEAVDAVRWKNLDVEYDNKHVWTNGQAIYYSDAKNDVQYKLNETLKKWEECEQKEIENLHGPNVWLDGYNFNYSDIVNGEGRNYTFNQKEQKWEEVEWTGLTAFNGYNVWTDGEIPYYSDGKEHYVLNVEKQKWEKVEWEGLTRFEGRNVGINDEMKVIYINDDLLSGTVGTYELVDGVWKKTVIEKTVEETVDDLYEEETTEETVDKAEEADE